VLLALEPTPLLGQVPAPFRQLVQADRAGLVSVQQPLVGPRDPLQPGAELLLGRLLAGGTRLGRGGDVVEPGEQLVGIGEQAGNVVPHRGLDRLGLDAAARAGRGPSRLDAVLAAAAVVAPLRLAGDGAVAAAEHGQAAAPAGEQAAQQVAVLLVVAEGESGVARKLRLGAVPGLLIDQRRHGNGDPLLARLELAARRLVGARAAGAARLLGRDEAVAVGVGRAGVDRVGKDVVHRGG
jgi:hypothetical protein